MCPAPGPEQHPSAARGAAGVPEIRSGSAVAIPPHRVAAFFDLDKTIIATSSAHALGKEFLSQGVITPLEAFQISLAKTVFMVAGQSSDSMDTSRDQLASTIAGMPVEQIREIADHTIHSVIIPTIYSEARELISFHKEAGHDVIIVSASATDLVEPIAKKLGADSVIATELEVVDGTYTGTVLSFNKGPEKAAAIHQLATTKGYDLAASYAYSDSATDLPMLESVGHPVAVNPDRVLRRTAVANEWEIRTFKNPEPLFTAPTAREVTIGTGVVAGLAAVTAAVMWVAGRKRGGAAQQA